MYIYFRFWIHMVLFPKGLSRCSMFDMHRNTEEMIQFSYTFVLFFSSALRSSSSVMAWGNPVMLFSMRFLARWVAETPPSVTLDPLLSLFSLMMSSVCATFHPVWVEMINTTLGEKREKKKTAAFCFFFFFSFFMRWYKWARCTGLV